MPTLLEYRQALSKKLTGFKSGTVAHDATATDTTAKRLVISGDLFDNEKDSSAYAGHHVWVGKYRDERRIKESGFSTLFWTIFNAPTTTSSYKLRVYGYSSDTSTLTQASDAAAIQTAILAIHADLSGVTVIGSNPYTIKSSTEIDIEYVAVSGETGSIESSGGLGTVEVIRPFTKALARNDVFEIHSKLPVLDFDAVQGQNTLINEALKKINVIDRIPVTPTTITSEAQVVFNLRETYPWLTTRERILAIFEPTDFDLVTTWTPGVASYTLTLTLASAYTTASIAAAATASTIQTAINAVSPIAVTVTGSNPYTITVRGSKYYNPAFSASSGTVSNVVYQKGDPARTFPSWVFQYDGPVPYLYFPSISSVGDTFFLEVKRPGHTLIAAQSSYGVLGTTWSASTTGLTDDYDQATPDVDEVAAYAYWLACKQLTLIAPGHEMGFWKDERINAARAIAYIQTYQAQEDRKPMSGSSYRNAGWGSKGFWGTGNGY